MTTPNFHVSHVRAAGARIIAGLLHWRTPVLLGLLLRVMVLIPVSTEAAGSAHGTWTMTGPMHQARGVAAAVLLPNGQVLVAGGCRSVPCERGNGVGLTSAELYNPRIGTWTETGSMHDPRLEFTLTLLPDGQVLATGGCTITGCVRALASAELYNPGTGVWTPTSSLHHARYFQGATLLSNGQVLISGGCEPVRGQCSILTSAELYSPTTGVWTVTGSMHDPRYRHRETLLPDGQVLVAGGCEAKHCSIFLASAELYNPQTGHWTRTGSLYQARAYVAQVLLSRGQVLIAGGLSPNGLLASTELYDPSSRKWTTAGSMSLLDGRFFETPETATLLSSGQVLVTGDGDFGALATTELYNPTSRTWTLSGSLRDARSFQITTLLSNGKVLVTGGVNASGQMLASSEIYNP